MKPSKALPRGARLSDMPSVVRPMLANLADAPFSHPDWIFELKWDGVRALCHLSDAPPRLVSRQSLEIGREFPEITDAAPRVNARSAILDGEIVALDELGRPQFQLLQPRLGVRGARAIAALAARSPAVYVLFDLLYYDGYDLTRSPLVDRKALLEELLPAGGTLRFSPHVAAAGSEFFTEVERLSLEGMIAKRAASLYHQKRSRDWLKVKRSQRLHVVIGGYTRPRRARQHFGSLVVGLYHRDGLRYVAHVGSGFDSASLAHVHDLLRGLETGECPFAERPAANEPVTWVTPLMVCEVQFYDWTSGGHLRSPVFIGLSPDHDPRECKAAPSS